MKYCKNVGQSERFITVARNFRDSYHLNFEPNIFTVLQNKNSKKLRESRSKLGLLRKPRIQRFHCHQPTWVYSGNFQQTTLPHNARLRISRSGPDDGKGKCKLKWIGQDIKVGERIIEMNNFKSLTDPAHYLAQA